MSFAHDGPGKEMMLVSIPLPSLYKDHTLVQLLTKTSVSFQRLAALRGR